MASSVIGALRVNLSANTAAFSKGLRGAETGLKRFERMAKVAATAVAGALAAAVGGVAVAMRGMISEADKMGKMAQSIGVPVDELSRLKHAADLSGVSLEQLSTSVGRLSRNMNDVAQGGGAEAKRAFDQLGISVKNTDGTLKSSSQVMAEVAERFRQMPDGAEKTALAIQLLGRSGAALIPMLNQGADGLNEMMAEADRLGITIDTKTAKAAERFNDNITRMNAAVRGIVNQFTIAMMPALDRLVGKLTAVTTDGKLLKEVIDTLITAFKWLAEQVAIVVNAFGQIKREWEAIQGVFNTKGWWNIWEAIKGVGEAGRQTAEENARVRESIEEIFAPLPVDRISDAFDTIGESAQNAGEAVDQATDGLANLQAEAEKVFNNTRTPMERFNEEVSRLRELFSQGLIDEDTFNRAMDQARSGLEKVSSGSKRVSDSSREAQRELRNLQSEAERVFNATRTPVEKLNIELERLKSLFAGGFIDEDTFNRAVDMAKGGLSQIGDAAKSIASTLESAFSSMFDSAIEGTLNLQDAVRSLLKDLTRMASSMMFRALFSGMGGGGGGLFGNLFGGLPGFAHGGSFTVGGSGGIDSQVVAFRATPGEHVSIGHDGGGAANIKLELKVRNEVPHKAAVEQGVGADGMPELIVREIEGAMVQSVHSGPLGSAIQGRFGLQRATR